MISPRYKLANFYVSITPASPQTPDSDLKIWNTKRAGSSLYSIARAIHRSLIAPQRLAALTPEQRDHLNYAIKNHNNKFLVRFFSFLPSSMISERYRVIPDRYLRKIPGPTRAEAKAAQEAKARAQAEDEAKAAQEAKARAQAEDEAKAVQEAKARAQAEAQAKAEAKVQADAQARACAAAVAQVAEAKVQADAQARARAAAVARVNTVDDINLEEPIEHHFGKTVFRDYTGRFAITHSTDASDDIYAITLDGRSLNWRGNGVGLFFLVNSLDVNLKYNNGFIEIVEEHKATRDNGIINHFFVDYKHPMNFTRDCFDPQASIYCLYDELPREILLPEVMEKVSRLPPGVEPATIGYNRHGIIVFPDDLSDEGLYCDNPNEEDTETKNLRSFQNQVYYADASDMELRALPLKGNRLILQQSRNSFDIKETKLNHQPTYQYQYNYESTHHFAALYQEPLTILKKEDIDRVKRYKLAEQKFSREVYGVSNLPKGSLEFNTHIGEAVQVRGVFTDGLRGTTVWTLDFFGEPLCGQDGKAFRFFNSQKMTVEREGEFIKITNEGYFGNKDIYYVDTMNPYPLICDYKPKNLTKAEAETCLSSLPYDDQNDDQKLKKASHNPKLNIAFYNRHGVVQIKNEPNYNNLAKAYWANPSESTMHMLTEWDSGLMNFTQNPGLFGKYIINNLLSLGRSNGKWYINGELANVLEIPPLKSLEG